MILDTCSSLADDVTTLLADNQNTGEDIVNGYTSSILDILEITGNTSQDHLQIEA